MKNVYLLYDSRYTAEPERATVYTVAYTLKEAKEDKEMFPDAVIVKCKELNGELTEPEIIE
jgi:hypothetical protein